LNIYIVPLKGVYSEVLYALAYMMVSIVMNEYYVKSIGKTVHI